MDQLKRIISPCDVPLFLDTLTSWSDLDLCANPKTSPMPRCCGALSGHNIDATYRETPRPWTTDERDEVEAAISWIEKSWN